MSNCSNYCLLLISLGVSSSLSAFLTLPQTLKKTKKYSVNRFIKKVKKKKRFGLRKIF